jgi:hypothetical protein
MRGKGRTTIKVQQEDQSAHDGLFHDFLDIKHYLKEFYRCASKT